MNKQQLKSLWSALYFVVSFVAAYYWLILLKDTDSYYSVYLICAILSIGGAFFFRHEERCIAGIIISLLLSMAVVLSNYVAIIGYSNEISCFLVGFVIFFNLYNLIKYGSKRDYRSSIFGDIYKYVNEKHFFIISASVLFISYGIYFASVFPGNLDTDSFNYIQQILSADYSDHHPICFTLLVRLFMVLGRTVTDNISIQVGLYCAFQMLLMIVVVSYILSTLYSLSNIKLSIISLLVFALVPTHIASSVTLWKDILFSIVFALYICTIARCLMHIGIDKANKVLMAIGACGSCLFRHNGKITILIFSIVLLFVSIKRSDIRKIAMVTLISAIASLGIIAGAKSISGAKDVGQVESLSVPIQQISRVIVDGYELTDDQEHMLSEVVDLSKIPDSYLNYVSDPIKRLIRDSDNQEYITQHRWKLLKVWAEIGLAHPVEYVKAWIDLTRGYYNGGYSYFKWINYIKENGLGIRRMPLNISLSQWYEMKFKEIAKSEFWLPIMSIGVHTWILLIGVALVIDRRRWDSLIVLIPSIILLLTLLIATPLDSETRYIYPLYLAMPITLGMIFERRRDGQKCSINPLP